MLWMSPLRNECGLRAGALVTVARKARRLSDALKLLGAFQDGSAFELTDE